MSEHEQLILLPIAVRDLFAQRKPAAAIRHWIDLARVEGGKIGQQEVAQITELTPSGFSSKLNGNYSWSSHELASVYQYLSRHSRTIDETEEVPLADLFGWSGIPAKSGKRYAFPREEPAHEYDVGVVRQGPLGDIDQGSGSGALAELIRLLVARRHRVLDGPDVERRIKWGEFDLADVDAARTNDIVIGLYPTPARRGRWNFIRIPALTIPLAAVVERRALGRLAEALALENAPNSGTRHSRTGLYNMVRSRRALFASSVEGAAEFRMLVIDGEIGESFVAGLCGIFPEFESVERIDKYDAAFCAERYCALLNDGRAPILFSDDIMASRVIQHIRSRHPRLKEKVVHLGSRRGNADVAKDVDFEFGLPRVDVSIAVRKGKEHRDIFVFLRDEIRLLARQEPTTLLQCVFEGFRQAEQRDPSSSAATEAEQRREEEERSRLAWTRMAHFFDVEAIMRWSDSDFALTDEDETEGETQ